MSSPLFRRVAYGATIRPAMGASLSGPEQPDHAVALIRFKGAFHEIAEGGIFPVGMCPLHVRRIAWFVPEGQATMFGPVEVTGWAGAFIQPREVGRQWPVEPFTDVQRLASRQHAEQFLMRGEEVPPCEHLTPRQLEAASRLVDGIGFVHPGGPCLKHAGLHLAGDCQDAVP